MFLYNIVYSAWFRHFMSYIKQNHCSIVKQQRTIIGYLSYVLLCLLDWSFVFLRESFTHLKTSSTLGEVHPILYSSMWKRGTAFLRYHPNIYIYITLNVWNDKGSNTRPWTRILFGSRQGTPTLTTKNISVSKPP